MNFDFISDRVYEYFTTAPELGTFSMIGFRWDFLLYGSVPILEGIYFVFKRKYNNQFYCILLSTYILTNAFWVLINEVPFSDRFAYLSWFMMPVVIIYPILSIIN